MKNHEKSIKSYMESMWLDILSSICSILYTAHGAAVITVANVFWLVRFLFWQASIKICIYV